MRNQFFADDSDYFKYGLLRIISSVTKLNVLIAWMLTSDKNGKDGKFTDYLEYPNEWEKYDPPLYRELKKLFKENPKREVSLIEKSPILKSMEFYSKPLPSDDDDERKLWFNELEKSKSKNIIFLDPDNGIEVKSVPYGRKHSFKYLYWHEISALWENKNSLLIFQYLPLFKNYDDHSILIQEKLNALAKKTNGSQVVAFRTPRVVFLMALQPKHQNTKQLIIDSVQNNWAGQIESVNLETVDEKTRAKTAINDLLRAD